MAGGLVRLACVDQQPSQHGGGLTPAGRPEKSSQEIAESHDRLRSISAARQSGGLGGDPDGRVSQLHLVSGLGHGLNEAAIAALKACRFSPGEKNGGPVPVRIRGFKIRFFANDE